MAEFVHEEVTDLRREASSNLRKLREAIGVNQDAFAKEMGVSRAALSYYENGSRTPDMDFINTVALKTGCSFDYLLGWSSTMKPTYLDFEYSLGIEEHEAEILDELCRSYSFRKLFCSDDFKKVLQILHLGAEFVIEGKMHDELVIWKCMKTLEPLIEKMLSSEINELLTNPEIEQQYNARVEALNKQLAELETRNGAALQELQVLLNRRAKENAPPITPVSLDAFEGFRRRMADINAKED